MKRLLILLFCFSLSLGIAEAQDVEQLIKAKPFAINGTLGLGFGTYNSSGIPARQRAFSYLFNGAPTVSIYGVSFPFSVVVSDQQRGFTQPFNQYGISPTYKWITVHAGWQSIQWSPYTLAGYNFLGGGVELNPGKLRFGFIYGRFNKAIEEDPALITAFSQTPAYKRTGFSTKIGLGTERNHFDFILLKAKDEVNSLQNKPSSFNLTPSENLVLGISSKVTFFKHFIFDIDASGSLYTRNLLADTVKNLKLDKVDFIKDLITLNASTQLLTAGQTSLGYQGQNYNVLVKYKRIDPDFKSMGAYYSENDVQNYTLEGGVKLLKGQMQLNGSFGLQNDNLLNDKAYQSNRKIGSINAAFNKTNYGIDVRYSNYGITQDRGLNPIVDTLRVAKTNHNLNAMLRYSIADSLISHSFILVGNLQSLQDLNRFTSAQSLSNSKTANFSYQLGFPKTGFNLNASLNYTVADIYLGHTVFFGPSLGVSKDFMEGKLGLNAAMSYQQQKNNKINAGNILNGSLNGSFRFTKKDAANLSLNYLKSNSKDISLPSFNEIYSNLTLSHSF
ncbi:hypothetical protein GM921_17340 [Pedobacter sp. LMG 31464]|uniref:DUF5723 domain-containing protein n=1 Tax=Pedobacter planticolens TaxID=2679964 RepID=A0A923IXK6_9SPHI|nr:hypothetical protein [Pedobacter planticolens]MBB2147269.1 hypothetical protein [Pedobacter planticolens]